ncbi:hypothetical protein F383_22485 [Gossypium arboreum]|uniref:Uncharacterized protein n=1 Tax=Gossypium arboreum TaxID=29729 RepID=A0A0B0MG35_GOSAR|nr:hypothetical protein F383_22485 [Gossypium arboreum]
MQTAPDPTIEGDRPSLKDLVRSRGHTLALGVRRTKGGRGAAEA